MSQTRVEIRNAWIKENMRSYGVSIHKTLDADMIDFIESERKKGYSINQIFKRGIEKLMEGEKHENRNNIQSR